MTHDRANALIAHILGAIESGDHAAIEAMLADQVELNTPRFLKPIRDRKHVTIVLQTIPKVIENFHYVRTWPAADEAIMEFKGNIGAIEVHGLDIFHLDASGKVDELTVFIRPTKAHAALGEAEDALILSQLEKAKGGAA